MINLDHVLKSRDITLLTKVCIVEAMVFPVVLHRCESWTKRRLSTRELMLLNCGVGEDFESPLEYKEIKQSILKEINPEYSLERPMLKLKLQYLGHLMWRVDSRKFIWCWEKLKGKREVGSRGLDGSVVSLTQWLWIWQTPGHREGQRSLACYSQWSCKEPDKT